MASISSDRWEHVRYLCRESGAPCNQRVAFPVYTFRRSLSRSGRFNENAVYSPPPERGFRRALAWMGPAYNAFKNRYGKTTCLNPNVARMKSKEEIEVDVFTSFAEVSRLLIRRESIVHQNPPQPDILCAQADSTRVVFEPTELVDNGFMRRLGFSTKCKDALRDCGRVHGCTNGPAIGERQMKMVNTLCFVNAYADALES